MKNPRITLFVIVASSLLIAAGAFLLWDSHHFRHDPRDGSHARRDAQARQPVAESSATPETQTKRDKVETAQQASPASRALDGNSADVGALLTRLRPDFRQNPQRTLDSLEILVPESSKRETLEMALFSDWATADPLAALAAARNCRFTSPDLKQVSPVRLALNQWATSSPEQAAEWLLSSAWYAEFPEDHQKSVEAVFVAWGRQNPDRGLEWLSRNQNQFASSRSAAIASLSLSAAVYGKDFATARDIAKLHPDSAKRDELLKRIAELERHD